ncbi:NB-ARC domain-containing protein [Spirulina sp. 06S082]|uniref:NB-ARC domain-containing protein n=1 Tax=Spirulina sp. 06S082 TaxID=3110248 RepID=UPI002B1EB485|nr:AAA family ATPase [Spirulina sp. 06S082]MEA5470047.1 AAA family ATPase [Spirulina sp. 06S082]
MREVTERQKPAPSGEKPYKLGKIELGEVLKLKKIPQLYVYYLLKREMARPSYGPRAKQRAKHLLASLLDFADDCLETEGVLKIHCNKQAPDRLVFQTKIRYLEQLTGMGDRANQLNSQQIKEAIARMKDFLGILEDNRAQTQGSDRWNFTLKLWYSYREKEKNLDRFDREWESKRPEKSKQVTGELIQSQHQNSPLTTIEAIEEETKAREYPYHNLPARDRAVFVGRTKELKQLLDFLAAHNPIHRISIEGMAGVGKTTLMMEVAHLCLEARQNQREKDFPRFDAIVFSCAKSHRFHAGRLLPRLQRESSLGDIFRAIANTLDCPGILRSDFSEQFQRLRERLGNQPTLLLLDNADTLEDRENILAFLYELPTTVKVLLTSRVQIQLDTGIHLDSLPEKQSLELIDYQAKLKQIPPNTFRSQPLYEKTEGNPMAIVYSIGQLASGYPFETVTTRLRSPTGEIARFCLEELVKPLRGQLSHRLLMAIALFAAPPTQTAIASVLGVEEAFALTDSLAHLQQLSLLKLEEGRYRMLFLTREYAIAALANHSQFEEEARSRWLTWYLHFSSLEGEYHWREWRDYGQLESDWDNIQAVFEWCIETGHYPEAKVFWRQIKGYSYIYGYWNERLNWLEGLLSIAQQQGDRDLEREVLGDRAWTLMLMGKPEQLAEAEDIFAELAKEVREMNPQERLELLHSRAILAFEQQDLSLALQWFESEKQLLATIGGDRRQEIRIQYYEAGIYCKMEDFPRAKTLYQQALKRSRELQWQQLEVYILNWLAEIAVMTGELEQAEALLAQSWPMARSRNDRRSIAFHQRTQAYLARSRGCMDASQKAAIVALNHFEALGMRSEAAQMREWGG